MGTTAELIRAQAWVVAPRTAQTLACALVVVQLAATGLVYRRFRPGISAVRRAVCFGALVGLLAAAAAPVKLSLTY